MSDEDDLRDLRARIEMAKGYLRRRGNPGPVAQTAEDTYLEAVKILETPALPFQFPIKPGDS